MAKMKIQKIEKHTGDTTIGLQVESAIRDDAGNKIVDTYLAAKATEDCFKVMSADYTEVSVNS